MIHPLAQKLSFKIFINIASLLLCVTFSNIIYEKMFGSTSPDAFNFPSNPHLLPATTLPSFFAAVALNREEIGDLKRFEEIFQEMSNKKERQDDQNAIIHNETVQQSINQLPCYQPISLPGSARLSTMTSPPILDQLNKNFPREYSTDHVSYSGVESLSPNFATNSMDILPSSPESMESLDLSQADNLQRYSPISHNNEENSTMMNTKTKRKVPKMYRFNPRPLTLKPSMSRGRKYNSNTENEDEEYKEKRRRNNEASRRSRMARRYKECMVMEEMQKLRKENEELRAEINLLKKMKLKKSQN